MAGGVAGYEQDVSLELADLNFRERLVLAPLAVLILVMGVYPSLFLSRTDQTIQSIKARISPAAELAKEANRDRTGIEER